MTPPTMPPPRRRPARAIAAAALIALAAAPLGGCTTNPATGGTTFTGFMDTADEVKIGREQHPKVLQAFGGEYRDPEIQRYVAGLGALLARTVERKDLEYRFTVLDSDVVNAMAIPGGYVYVTRGLLALADNEAQLAGVLAHELGHLTALHHASQHGQSLLANILVGALGVAGGGLAAQGGSLLAGTTLLSFSREQEYQADELGIRYMARAGYDPAEMSRFLDKLRGDSRLAAALAGRSPDAVDQFNYLATHPAPIERVRRAAALAAETPVRDPMVAADVYLGRIDGLIYGDSPDEGFIRGRAFLHPGLGIRFEVPPGFRLVNTPRAVVGQGPDGARILFDGARAAGPVGDYLTGTWGRSLRLSGLAALDVNGFPAATGTTQLRIGDRPYDLRLIAIRTGPERVFRFVFATPTTRTAQLAEDLQRATYSLRPLAPAEAAGLKPNRVRIVRVRPGDTADAMAAAMPFSDRPLERFQVLNGLEPGAALVPGRAVKLIAE